MIRISLKNRVKVIMMGGIVWNASVGAMHRFTIQHIPIFGAPLVGCVLAGAAKHYSQKYVQQPHVASNAQVHLRASSNK